MGYVTCGHPSSLLSLLLSPEPGPDVDRSVQRWAREYKWVQAQCGGRPRLTWSCDPLAQLCALGTQMLLLCPPHLRLGVCVAEGLCCLPRAQSPHSQAPDRM